MTLNHSQMNAVISTAPLTLVIAGPGSGKTGTLIERIKYRILFGTPCNQIVAITFTNDAANEIKKRLGDITIGYCGTLHGYMLRLIQQHHNVLGMPERVTVMSQDVREKMLFDSIDAMACKAPRSKIDEVIKRGPLVPGPEPFAIVELVSLEFYGRMRREGLVDFDSILHYGLEIIHKVPMRLFDLLVDEVQDSNEIQMTIYRAMQADRKFLVGDVDQSIYGFNGAVPQKLLELPKWDDAEVVFLEDNYRSDIAICVYAQLLIEKNRVRFNKVTRPVSKKHGKIHSIEFEFPLTEYSYIAGELKQLDPIESVVLVRSNRLADEIRLALEGFGIQVRRKQPKQMPPDWDMTMLMLAVVSNPENDRVVHAFIQHKAGLETADKIKFEAMENFSTINQTYLHVPEVPVEKVCEFLSHHGITAESRLLVRNALESKPASLAELVLSLSGESASEETGQGVLVTTMHSSKGREWDNVFLPCCEDGIIPAGKSDVEEERRLFFVAMTRARHRLCMTYSKSRALPKYAAHKPEMSAMQPSRFLNDISLAAF